VAVKAGQILFTAEGFVVDRIQSGGVTNLNIPTTNVHEVGNFLTVDIIRDLPDLSFDIQSLDVSTDIEAMTLDLDPSSVMAGTGGSPTPTTLDFLNARPIDVTSPFRSGNNLYNIVKGIVVPYLTLEQVAYKYGLKADAQETFTYRGDAIYYLPGVPVREKFAGSIGGGTVFPFSHGPARLYTETGNAIYAVSVWWSDPTTGLFKRLFHGQDFTDTSSGITLNVAVASTCFVHVCYGTAASGSTSAPYYYGATSTSSIAVKPGAIRSKDMDIYIGVGATPVMTRMPGVQTWDGTWKVTLQNDEEFGNAHYISSDYDVPTVSGTIGLKGVDPADTIHKIQQLAGVPYTDIAGPLTAPAVPMEVRLRHPSTGALIKTIYIPDATFTAPPVQGKQNSKLDLTLKWDSLSGAMQVFKGERIGGEV
jgi:hypothetical protein